VTIGRGCCSTALDASPPTAEGALRVVAIAASLYPVDEY
jgi:hypothetical protein